MLSNRVWWLAAAAGLSLVAFGEDAPRAAPIPSDPLEMAGAQSLPVDASANRAAAVRLLNRARASYALRSARLGYDLKVSFTVDSGGLTKYDGTWEMEDIYDPAQGLRWTAKNSTSYAISRISMHGMLYGEDSEPWVPLRLQEARAALFDPLPSAESVNHASIRTSNAVFHGTPLTCVLLSASKNASAAAIPGRRWDETEECIDPRTGLLRVHSQVPGRYNAYEYMNAPRLNGHVLPRKVIVTEAGKVVTDLSVDSLTQLKAADASLFVPSDEMKSRGRAISMGGAQKILRVSQVPPSAAGATTHAVCVFGVVTPSGELVEAHSLQPSDPNSQAAVEAAKEMNFSNQTARGTLPQQHFVFIIEKFVASQ